MNKKLIILIVALECVFSVFLISIFGPMIEALHSKVLVEDLYLLDEEGQRMVAPEGQELPSVKITMPGDIDYKFTVMVESDEATDKSFTITHNRSDEEIEITQKKNVITVTFITLEITDVTVTVTANDGSLCYATVIITKSGGSTNVGDDFQLDP